MSRHVDGNWDNQNASFPPVNFHCFECFCRNFAHGKVSDGGKFEFGQGLNSFVKFEGIFSDDIKDFLGILEKPSSADFGRLEGKKFLFESSGRTFYFV